MLPGKKVKSDVGALDFFARGNVPMKGVAATHRRHGETNEPAAEP